MRHEVRLQQLSMGMSDAEIVEWCVGDGDQVTEGGDLVEIEAEKATHVVPAPASGTVRDIQGAAGDVVEVRQLLCVIDTAS